MFVLFKFLKLKLNGESMLRRVARRRARDIEYEELLYDMRQIFRLKNEDEFAENIIEKLVEMAKKGYKVYVTNRAAEKLEPLLEKYGIALVPARRIERPYLLIDVDDKDDVFVRFKADVRKFERILKLEVFMEHLRRVLELETKEKREMRIYVYNPSFF